MPASILPRVPRLCEPCRTRTDSRSAIIPPAIVAFHCPVSSASPKVKVQLYATRLTEPWHPAGQSSTGPRPPPGRSTFNRATPATRHDIVQPGHARHPPNRRPTGPRPPHAVSRRACPTCPKFRESNILTASKAPLQPPRQNLNLSLGESWNSWRPPTSDFECAPLATSTSTAPSR